jgi:UDP-N-acetylmuramyl pentapeptide phosphotransferase/UDP-N-acetylglucosamine-1-phosphate transferase
MEDYLPAIFALIVGAAGWYYLFYSRAALQLQGIENARQNQRRVRLRQVGGFVIICLAASFYAMFVMLRRQRLTAAVSLLVVVTLLMAGLIVLGWIDLRYTQKMRQERRRPRE